MTKHDFIVWLNGFVDGVHEYNVTPKQWDILRDTLKNVNASSATGHSLISPTTISVDSEILNGVNSMATMYPSGSMWTYTNTFTNHIK